MNIINLTSSRIFRFGLPVAAVLLMTLLLEPVHERISTITIALTFLLLVLFSATFFGRNPALVASFAAMLCFNFFFLPPFRTLRIAEPPNLMAWAAFTITAIITGELSAYARRRAAEAEKQRIEIEGLYSELQDAFDKAAQAEAFKRSEKLKSSLLDAVTHDLRTPLTAIKASVTTLLENEGGHRTIELDSESRLEFLDVINEETDRLNNFIEGMVEMARVEAGASDSQQGTADTNEAISLALERAANLTKNRRIKVDLEDKLRPAGIESKALAEAIFTLLDNAAKYSPAGTPITVISRSAGEEIEITVADEGPGIPENMREKVFEKFHRLEKVPGSGLGLGLTIARGIVESHKGRIRIEGGNNGVGIRAIILIPSHNASPQN
jgi:two-component system sensor histidine kinase KdpD